MALSRFDNSLYKTLLEFNNAKVVDWVRNVYSKIKNDGILPKYIDREKQEDFSNIDIDKAEYVSNLEVNSNFTFDRCISGQDLPLEREVNIGTSHVIEFEVSSDNFANFKLFVDGIADINYVSVEIDQITYKCASNELIFTPTAYGNPSKVTIIRNNFVVSCLVDGVQVDQLSLASNSEFYFNDLLISSEGVELGDVKYGFLYNQHAIQGIGDYSIIPLNMANTGWKIPTFSDFYSLVFTYLGDTVAGGKLKEANLNRWNTPNTGATNEVGFTGVGSGIRTTLGVFSGLKAGANIWATSVSGGIDGLSFYYNESYAAFGSYGAKAGLAIRLVRLATTPELSLADGTEVDVYIGNDLREYRAVKIDNKVWLAENLAETKYRGGANIVEVMDSGTWSVITYGARCSYDNDIENAFYIEQPYTVIKLGLLYNWYAVTDLRGLINSGFQVATYQNYIDLDTYLTNANIACKEVGIEYWNTNNGLNLVNFNARGGGRRIYSSGLFEEKKDVGIMWTSNSISTTSARVGQFSDIGNDIILNVGPNKKQGNSVRGVRDATVDELLLPDGTYCTPYTGNDGKIYRTVKINNKVWIADNLAETKYNNGDWIPGYDGGTYTPILNVTWIGLTDGACCAYGDDVNNI